jgi:uncharacterized membrane protein YqjE
VSYQPPEPPEENRSVGDMVFDVSERVSTLIRDEIELAKAEVSEKVQWLLRGGVVGIVAGTFAFLGLILLMHSIAWLLNDLFFGDHFWIGFLIEAVVFFVTAAIAGYVARGAVQKGSPPTPDLAIEEGRRIKQTLEAGTTPAADEPVTPPAQQPATPPAQQPATSPAQQPAAPSAQPPVAPSGQEPAP